MKLSKNKTNISKFCIIFILLLNIYQVHAAGLETAKFKNYRDLTVVNTGYNTFALTPDIYSNTAINFPDLRIVDSQNNEIPYHKYYMMPSERTQQANINFKIINRSTVNGKIIATFTRENSTETFDELFIDINSTNYLLTPKLFGSSDGKNFTPIATSEFLYSFEDKYKGKNNLLKFDKVDYDYIKGEFEIATSKDAITAEKIQKVYYTKKAKILTQPKIIASNIISNQVKDKVSIIDIDCGYNNLPLVKLNIIATDKAFTRDIDISYSNSNEPNRTYNPLISSVTSSYSVGKYSINNTSITLPTVNARYIRLTIYNNDNQPLTITGTSVFYQPENILFEGDKNQKYKLFYGSQSYKTAPVYDISYLSDKIDNTSLTTATLSAEQTNPTYKGEDVPPQEHSKLLINISIGLIVCIVGFLIAKNLKSFEKKEE